jgi:hypothetical protein
MNYSAVERGQLSGKSEKATGSVTMQQWFDYRQGQEIYLLLKVQTGSGVQPAYCSSGTRRNFQGG